MKIEPKGSQASRVRQRKFELLRTLRIPPDALPGSLSVSKTRCGKPTCRCAAGGGHEAWLLTFMVNGKKRTERVPREWVDEVARRVDDGKQFRDRLAELFAANAELVVLSRKQRR